MTRNAGRVWPASAGLLAGYGAMAVMTTVAVAVGATRRPAVALFLLAVTALVIATRTTAPAALGVGAIGWLFYTGFITGRHGDLVWHGTAGLIPLAVLEGTVLSGLALGWFLARSASARPEQPAPEQPAPEQPARRRPAPVVVGLTRARRYRHG